MEKNISSCQYLGEISFAPKIGELDFKLLWSLFLPQSFLEKDRNKIQLQNNIKRLVVIAAYPWKLVKQLVCEVLVIRPLGS